ncbi:MAG: hypothetical protein P4M11_07600 [Candidatus Pacebacteria bacterium]|nr:hypothetical protein [Candidatus Paceibacterota bacterium]
MFNFVVALGLIVAWAILYYQHSYPNSDSVYEDSVQRYALFFVFAALSLGSLVFALVCFVDSDYQIRVMLDVLRLRDGRV